MRVLLAGDSPTVETGFARCTRAACGRLLRRGHQVAVMGISYDGWPHGYPFPVYPARSSDVRDWLGLRQLPRVIAHFRPDVVVLLNDPWNVPGYMRELEESDLQHSPPVVGWLAVDAKNHPHSAELNSLAHVVCWTQFAVDELRTGGCDRPTSVVPLGVNLDQFLPHDREAARREVLPDSLPPGAFVVGTVGRNQPRKRLDLMIGYFAEFVRRAEATDAYLSLHVSPTGERAADLRALCAYHGLAGRVAIADNPVGQGFEDARMPLVYSSFDVYLTTTQGEGWGLPVMEAMACGVPCVVPDWSALGEWPGDAAIRVPCTSTALSAPLNNFPYTVGGVPDLDATVAALTALYRDRQLRDVLAVSGRVLVEEPRFRWESVGDAVADILEGVVGRSEAESCVPVLANMGRSGGVG